jgi:queuine tRNA-ribosyltransferase
LDKAGGLHKFMNWNGNILTDSGGFQMVSLLKLARIIEEGVEFEDPKNPGSKSLLTPEQSMRFQNEIGSDIMMALDDVVSSTETHMDRINEATYRTTRWIDRCIKAHSKPSQQNLFGIVQGHLHPDLRTYSLKELIRRDLPGYAIGGLSGGESKHEFWKVVEQCTRPETGLPPHKPRYLMGVGYSLDLVICVALGVDMFDCVYPCRTARFGTALVRSGTLRLTGHEFATDNQPIEKGCNCETCANYTRAALHTIVTKEPVASTLLTIHNFCFLMRLMSELRNAIAENVLPAYVRTFLREFFPLATPAPCDHCPPRWVKGALDSVGIGTDDMFDWGENPKELPDMPHHHSKDKGEE